MATAVLGLLGFGLWGLPSVDAARLDPFLPHGAEGVLASLLTFLAFGGFDMVAAAVRRSNVPSATFPGRF